MKRTLQRKNRWGSKTIKGASDYARPLLIFMEAASGFEPLSNGFADRSLTTWVCRLRLGLLFYCKIGPLSSVSRKNLRGLSSEGCNSLVDRRVSKFFLDAEQLVVLGYAVRPR